MFQIRPIKTGELGWIMQSHSVFYEREFGWGKSFEAVVARIILNYLESEDDENQICYIADISGKPVGSVMVLNGTNGVAKLHLMYVSDSTRGQGIASALVSKALSWAKDKDFHSITLGTTENQISARNLYSKFGFERVLFEPNYSFAKGSLDETWSLDISKTVKVW